MIPERGAVLGIDVGWSARKTTGMAALWWDESRVWWRCGTASSRLEDRTAVLETLTSGVSDDVLAVAVDGPLLPELVYGPTYRCPEVLLTLGAFGGRGKPGACNAGGGPRLHEEAITLAKFALERRDIRRATHKAKIHERAVVEAFPNLFLGVLCDEAKYPRPARKRRWTDVLFPSVLPRLEEMLASLLPKRTVKASWAVRGHDAIAGFVCALTALCVAAASFVAVGSHRDGFIILPPYKPWGADAHGRQERWAERELRRNVARSTAYRPLVYRNDTPWMGDGCNDATRMGGNGEGCKDATRMGGNGGAVQPPHSS